MAQQTMSLADKKMGSLSNSSINSKDLEEDELFIEKRKHIPILRPENNLRKSTRIIEPDSTSLNIPGKISNASRKKRKLLLSGPTPKNTLKNTSENTSQNCNKSLSRKSKHSVVVIDVGKRESNIPYESGLLTSMSDEVASFFDKVHESPKKAQLDKYVQEKREKDRLETERSRNTIDSELSSQNIRFYDLDSDSNENTTKTIKKFLKRNMEGSNKPDEDISLEEMIHDKSKYKELKKKYEKTKSYVKPDLISSTNDIELLVENHLQLIVDILNGVQASYFYKQAKELQQSSELKTIKDSEIANLPKGTYYGYIGAIRGFHIGKAIENNSKLSKLLLQKLKFSSVIQFWGIFNFIQYVLVPEVIANITMKHSKIYDLDKAYDEMEETNEYGLYVTNQYPLEKKDDFCFIDDNELEEGKEAKAINAYQRIEPEKSLERSKLSSISSGKSTLRNPINVLHSDLDVTPPSSPDNLFD